MSIQLADAAKTAEAINADRAAMREIVDALKQHHDRLSALESLTAWVNDPAPPDTTIDHLAEIQKIILWVLKQPWERDVASWEELVRLASKGTEKSLTFRQEVVTPPPVRDLL